MPKFTLHFHRGDEAEVEAEASSYEELKERILRGELTPTDESSWGNLMLFFCEVDDENGNELGQIELGEICYD